jgi:hypothetical protein
MICVPFDNIQNVHTVIRKSFRHPEVDASYRDPPKMPMACIHIYVLGLTYEYLIGVLILKRYPVV